MDNLQLLISIIALFVSGLALFIGSKNYCRLKELDDKNEYKDKRILSQECLGEVKELIERITLETEELFVRRNNFDLLDSQYIGSYGFQKALNEFDGHIRVVQTQLTKTKTIYGNLSNYVKLDDKEAFDECLNAKNEMKNIYLIYVKHYSKAKSQVDCIERLAKFQK
ncbi:hypothetical protein L4D77_16820 [Photobacterium frigidiphilum]|uniref:Uncharacterized protein n=1 Tax=Photobacterium frigidiphilum TaxID=264736 RepID=A0A2T3JKH0_9GAMM|nr:hypothetical protein [Photobacterium frigidiphilum]PSU49523.1 hypothetical protein C9J12_08540 [Photobacterium frigidiphilum]